MQRNVNAYRDTKENKTSNVVLVNVSHALNNPAAIQICFVNSKSKNVYVCKNIMRLEKICACHAIILAKLV